MKKHLLLAALMLITILTNAQISIPNGNFESWTSSTYDYPLPYAYTSNVRLFFAGGAFNVTKTTDAYHGSYALQLASISTFGYAVNANPENGDPTEWKGGIAINEAPTGIRGYYKYNVTGTDSAVVIITFTKSGVNIGTYAAKIGGIHNTYTLFDYDFSPALAQTPDSVVIGFASSDITQYEDGVPGSILLIDSVSFKGVSSQPALMGGDFESWQSQTIYKPNDWNYLGENLTGMNITNDAYDGNHAIALQTFLGRQNNQPAADPGMISTGYWDDNCSCMKGGYPFSNMIDTLAFYYKYAPADANDSAIVQLNFYKNGTAFFGNEYSIHASSNYSYAEIPFNMGQAPDTVIINIMSSAWNNTALSFIGSVLKIDEMHFKSQPLTTEIFNFDNSSISIYPNPVKDNLVINNLPENPDNYNAIISNAQGQVVLNAKLESNKKINVSGLSNGIYFLTLQGKTSNYTSKIIIQK